MTCCILSGAPDGAPLAPAAPIGDDVPVTPRALAPLVVLAALALPAALPADAAACSCAVVDERAQRASADVVFTGRVTAIDDPAAGSEVVSTADPVLAAFRVLRVRKGAVPAGTLTAGLCDGSVRVRAPAAPAVRGRRRARVVTSRSSASCGLDLRVGEVWRIYGRRAGSGEIPRPSSVAGALLG